MTLEYFAALSITLAVEIPVAMLFGEANRRGQAAATCLAVNLVSHPIAYYTVTNGVLSFAPTELLVTVFEAMGYKGFARLSLGRAALTSTVANGLTAALSFVLPW